jgi:hypothetical protein
LIIAFLGDLLSDNGSIDISVRSDIDALLAELEEGMNLEKVRTISEEKRQAAIELLSEHLISSRIASLILGKMEELEITPELVAQVKKILVGIWFQNEGCKSISSKPR